MGRGPKWTREDERVLKELYASGEMAKSIAFAMGRSRKAIHQKISEMGASRAPRPGGVKNTELRGIAMAFKGKRTASQIAEMCGCTRNAVIGHWRRGSKEQQK